MANLKSSKKDIRRTQKRTLRNDSAESKVRTFLKRARSAVSSENATFDKALLAIVDFESTGMKAAAKGIVAKKSISRKVSILVQSAKERFAVK